MSELGPKIRTLAPPSETKQFPTATQVAAELCIHLQRCGMLLNCHRPQDARQDSEPKKLNWWGKFCGPGNISGNWFFLRIPKNIPGNRSGNPLVCSQHYCIQTHNTLRSSIWRPRTLPSTGCHAGSRAAVGKCCSGGTELTKSIDILLLKVRRNRIWRHRSGPGTSLRYRSLPRISKWLPPNLAWTNASGGVSVIRGTGFFGCQ